MKSPSASQASREPATSVAQDSEAAAAEMLLGASESTLGTSEFRLIEEQAAKVSGPANDISFMKQS